MKEYSLLRKPRPLRPNKKLLPTLRKKVRVKHPKYFNKKMRELRKGRLG